jgi:hypothetical protein
VRCSFCCMVEKAGVHRFRRCRSCWRLIVQCCPERTLTTTPQKQGSKSNLSGVNLKALTQRVHVVPSFFALRVVENDVAVIVRYKKKTTCRTEVLADSRQDGVAFLFAVVVASLREKALAPPYPPLCVHRCAATSCCFAYRLFLLLAFLCCFFTLLLPLPVSALLATARPFLA